MGGPLLDQRGHRSDKQAVNTDTIRKQITGPGPFVIRTSDGMKYSAPHGDFVGFTRHYLMVEDDKGVLDILDPLDVVSIRPAGQRRSRARA
ncbi:hypothetical protein LBMAG56_31280 [Verrucomicrobiota bacterium]|nr:hypothetical protein LBMAG56_31280 [Verrucomicrobiota bacterium]